MKFAPVTVAALVEQSSITDKTRLRLEAELMRDRTRAVATLVNGNPTWIEVVEGPLSRTRYLFAVALPVSGWPFRPPEARVLEPAVSGPHRYGNDRLCLLPTSEYRPSLSVLFIRNRAVAWIGNHEVYQRTGLWPRDER